MAESKFCSNHNFVFLLAPESYWLVAVRVSRTILDSSHVVQQ